MPSGVLSEGGLSSNNNVAPTCQLHPSLGHRHPENQLKKYCNHQPQLGCLLLPPPTRKILKGGTNNDHNTFRIRDVQLFIGQQPYNTATASNAVLVQYKFVSLLLTTHKNGVKGEYIGHGHIGYPQGYPVLAMRLQMAYLQLQGTTREIPISSFKKDKKCQRIRGDNITAVIRAVV